MQPEPIRLWDLRRLLLGETTWSFSLEVVVRLVFLYAILIVALRLMGRRLASRLTRSELAALIALAAAVGPAVASPDQGLLPPVIVAGWVILMQRWIGLATFRSGRFEHLVQGESAALVKDGRLDLAAMKRNAISRDALYAALRNVGVTQLGAVERVYLEPQGSFTVIEAHAQRPGLSVIPDWDVDFDAQRRPSGFEVCASCGAQRGGADRSGCSRCGCTAWTAALPS